MLTTYNPLSYKDPTGNRYNPIYDYEGNHLGNTSEGFTGKVLMYSGTDKVDWSSMNVSEACKLDGVTTYDVIRSQLSGDTKSKIWTNIASHFEGMSVFDLKFTMKDMLGEKIHFGVLLVLLAQVLEEFQAQTIMEIDMKPLWKTLHQVLSFTNGILI